MMVQCCLSFAGLNWEVGGGVEVLQEKLGWGV